MHARLRHEFDGKPSDYGSVLAAIPARLCSRRLQNYADLDDGAESSRSGEADRRVIEGTVDHLLGQRPFEPGGPALLAMVVKRVIDRHDRVRVVEPELTVRPGARDIKPKESARNRRRRHGADP